MLGHAIGPGRIAPMIHPVIIGLILLLGSLLPMSGCHEPAPAPPPHVIDRSPTQQNGGDNDSATNQRAHSLVPKTGQHGLLVRCGGAPGPAHDPVRVANELRRDPNGFFNRHAERALRLHEITGNARIVFHMINGWDYKGMTRSAAVLGAMPPERRRAFEAMVKRLNEAGVTVGVYTSSKVPQVTDSVMVDDVEPIELFDYDNPRHRKVMIDGIIEPLIEIGVKEIWFDASSGTSVRDEFARLAEEFRGRAYIVMEAVPRVPDTDGEIDLATARRIASTCLDRFIYNSNDLRGDHWLPLPKETEIIAIISGHQNRDDEVPEKGPERKRYLAEQITKRLQQGFTIFLMDESLDAEFLALVQAWKSRNERQSKPQ